ncbi:alpha/beta fold hydrolase [Mycolicibacterium sphagni]|uniref:alpha/beta fold hydrolase n=1 Tax=Mycolicibacterium sphagni TaxID=1786 RepID=UPI0026814B44
MRLGDGRAVGYAQYGAPDSTVIVNAHGGLACRLDVAAADTAAREAGVRLISPDRPGIGESDPQPGRTILDWAGDISEILNNLGVEQFSAME